MATTTHAFRHLAQRVVPGLTEQQQVARLPRAGSELADRLLGHLNDPTTNPGTEKQQIARSTAIYIRAVQDMSYAGTRELLGLLTAARSGDNNLQLETEKVMRDNRTEPALRTALSALQNIYSARIREEGSNKLLPFTPHGKVSAFDGEFLNSAILLTRVSAPLGINIVQPEWNPEKSPTTLSAAKTSLLWLCGTAGSIHDSAAIAIKPNSSGSGVTIKLIERGEDWGSTTHAEQLTSGSTVTIGRALHLLTKPAAEGGSLFGLSIPDLKISPQLNPSLSFKNQELATPFSRAGLMIAMLGEHLTILDCGSRHGLTSPLENGACWTYVPKTVIDGQGKTRLGDTEFSLVPRPKLEE